MCGFYRSHNRLDLFHLLLLFADLFGLAFTLLLLALICLLDFLLSAGDGFFLSLKVDVLSHRRFLFQRRFLILQLFEPLGLLSHLLVEILHASHRGKVRRSLGRLHVLQQAVHFDEFVERE